MTENLATSVLRHVVLFNFKATATPAQSQEVERAFVALPTQIPNIRTLEWGTNVSPENLSAGYTHCFLLTFATEADRDAYLPHPAHKAFVALIQPYVGQVLVVDYWSQA
ncbi:MAG: Dabb family protein [Chloroflexi bacterium]|nr:Dabb family protein [Chloroflexota bacterium]